MPKTGHFFDNDPTTKMQNRITKKQLWLCCKHYILPSLSLATEKSKTQRTRLWGNHFLVVASFPEHFPFVPPATKTNESSHLLLFADGDPRHALLYISAKDGILCGIVGIAMQDIRIYARTCYLICSLFTVHEPRRQLAHGHAWSTLWIFFFVVLTR